MLRFLFQVARSLQLPDSGFHVKRSSREMISCVCRSADPTMHMLNELIVGHDAARNGNGFLGTRRLSPAHFWTLFFTPFGPNQKLATPVKLTPSLLLWARDNCAHGIEPGPLTWQVGLTTTTTKNTLKKGGFGCRDRGVPLSKRCGREQSAECDRFNCSDER